MKLQLARISNEKGFSLVELILAVVIMIIALVPVMDSITGSLQYAHSGEEYTMEIYYARQKMEDVLAMDYFGVDVSTSPGAPTALSDTVIIFGKTVNRDVFVEYYDGDGDSAADSDLKKITVIVDKVRHETLMAFF